ncbi:MAG: TIGR03067 domain-containing protein [Candidatus Udaeobacter sp.]
MIGSLMAADEDKGEISKDLMALQGTWRLAAGEIGGRKMTAEELKESKLVFQGDRYTVRRGNGPTVTGSVVINSTKHPNTIDITDADGPYKGETLLGIYALNDDEFTECFSSPGEARPANFATKTGTTQFLHVWKHVKD